MSKQNLDKKRLSIIKPFLDGEKKLKDIEKDSGVSYATLKRWVKSYKETGQKGLKKKVRKDKSQHRNISDKTLKFIRNTYLENPGMNISTLYKKYSDFIEDLKEESVSYNTIYRLVNNMDNFIQSHAELHLKRVQRKNQAYRMSGVQLSVEVLDPATGNIVNPYIYICYDLSNMDILNYRISISPFDLDHALFLLRDTILNQQPKTGGHFLPDEFFIDTFKIKNSKRIKFLKNELDISVKNSFVDILEINRFSGFLREDILKLIDSPNKIIDLESLDRIVYSYIYMTNKKISAFYDFSLSREFFEERLDILLAKTSRRVQEYGIRFKNNLYKHPLLRDHISEKVELRFDPFDQKKIYIYHKHRYLCTAYSV